MASNGTEDPSGEIKDELESGRSSKPPKLKNYRIVVPSLRSRLLDQHTLNPQTPHTLNPQTPSAFKNFRMASPVAVFMRTVDRKEEISLSVPSPAAIRRRLPIHFIRKIKWASVFRICAGWLMNPMNIALVLWLLCVAAAGAMLGLLLLGLLNTAFPTTSSRNYWIEIDNQVLNALFTLMSLYQHPNLFHHLALLYRWRSEDVIELRKTYCKNAAYRPREWAHMMVVIALLHITCFAQYILCGLYWGYPSETRPEWAENLFFALGTVAPVIAAVYTVYSPLGREFDSESDEESQIGASGADDKQPSKLGLNLYDRRVLVSKPEWVGGLFDCNEDTTVGYLSFFCTCCVFGWNVERLGFGNMYVHIVTFLLLCVAPFWIFNITALNINNYMIGDIFGAAGIVLCVCGLLYGGFWRIQMRKKFKLPGNTLCCGSASLTDYVQWMFCWSCSLAQEVRTGNFYDIEDDSLYRKLIGGDEESQPVLHPQARDGGSSPLMRSDHCYTPLPVSFMTELPISIVTEGECSSSSGSSGGGGDGSSSSISIGSSSSSFSSSLMAENKLSMPALDDAMTPPVHQVLQLEDGAVDAGITAPSMKSEGRAGDGETIPPPPSSPLIQTEDRVCDRDVLAPLIRVENRVIDGDTIGQPLSSPAILTEDDLIASSKIGKFVQIMQYSLFIVIVYALGATLLR